jgi:hypothetical protein
MDGVFAYAPLIDETEKKYKIYADAELVIKGEGASEAGSWEYEWNSRHRSLRGKNPNQFSDFIIQFPYEWYRQH